MNTLRRVFGEFKETTQKYGYEAPPEQIGWSLPIYVADTDEQAVEEARPHLEHLFNVGLRMPKQLFFPAGYLTPQGMARIMASKSGLVAGGMTIETLMEKGFVAVGSPDTVRAMIEGVQNELGFGTLVANFHFATMPHEQFSVEPPPLRRPRAAGAQAARHPGARPCRRRLSSSTSPATASSSPAPRAGSGSRSPRCSGTRARTSPPPTSTPTASPASTGCGRGARRRRPRRAPAAGRRNSRRDRPPRRRLRERRHLRRARLRLHGVRVGSRTSTSRAGSACSTRTSRASPSSCAPRSSR